MVSFPQLGGCLCAGVRYSVGEDPVTVYVCHCTECQRQTGASFALSMIVRNEALAILRGHPQEARVELPAGRIKRPHFCGRCGTRLWAPSSISGLTVVEPGTLDDASWFRPVGHIWTRSAQPWVSIPSEGLIFEAQPQGEEALALARAWKEQASRVSTARSSGA